MLITTVYIYLYKYTSEFTQISKFTKLHILIEEKKNKFGNPPLPVVNLFFKSRINKSWGFNDLLIKLWGKSVGRFPSYDWTNKHTNPMIIFETIVENVLTKCDQVFYGTSHGPRR